LFLLAFDLDGSDFRIEATAGLRRRCVLLRHERKPILLFPRDLVLHGESLGGLAHQHLGQRTEKSVAVHAVDELLVAETISPARTLEIIREPRHRFVPPASTQSRLPVAISWKPSAMDLMPDAHALFTV